MRYEIRAELPKNECVDFDVTGPLPTDDGALDKVRHRAELELIKRFPQFDADKFNSAWRGYVVFVYEPSARPLHLR